MVSGLLFLDIVVQQSILVKVQGAATLLVSWEPGRRERRKAIDDIDSSHSYPYDLLPLTSPSFS